MSARTGNRSDDLPRIECAAAVAYAILYIAYLFLYPENEFAHWLTLVAIPFAGLRLLAWRYHGSFAGWRAHLQCFGLGRPRARGVVAAVAVVGCVSALQLLGRNGAGIRELFVSGRALWLWPASMALMVLTAATTEEFFFRGVVQARLAAVLPVRGVAVVIAALLFSLYHVPYAMMTPGWGTQGDLVASMRAAFATGLPLGILFGIVFSAGGQNLVVSILAHAGVNSLPGMVIVERWLGG
jgi:membrane protease YdiL (CAAX protease family)